MVKKHIFSVFFLVLAMSSNSVCGQRVLSLSELRDLAIQNNNELKVATQEERVAYYQKKEAFLQYFPKLSATGSYLRNQKDIYLLNSSVIPTSSITVPLPSGNVDIPTGPINETLYEGGHLDIKNIWVAGISLTQPLFTGGRIVTYNDITKNAEELARSKKDTQLQDIISELDASYWQTVSFAEKKRLTESYLNLLKKMTSDIKIMHEEGVATKADVLSVVVKMNEADVSNTKVSNGLALSRMQLNQLSGLPIEEQITLVDEGNQLMIENIDSDVPSVEEALHNRSEIKSLELATKIYKGKEKIARAEFMPTVGFTANYLWTNPNSFNGFQNKMNGMWTIGVVASLPLNIFTSSAKLNAAKAETMAHEFQLEEAKEKIELQVNQASFKLSEAYKTYEMALRNMENADENLRYANAGFEEGVISASDALAAHTAWLSAHSEIIDSQIDIKLCKVYLNKSLGRSLK